MRKTQISMRLPAGMPEALDELVDGVTFASRAQICLVALDFWLQHQDIDWRSFNSSDPRQMELVSDSTAT